MTILTAVTSTAAPLAAQGIVKRFGDKAVLNGIDVTVQRGEVVALVGENGAGKTTMLRICAGLLAPDEGVVSIASSPGFCPQDPCLMDLLSTEEHLTLFGAGRGMSRDHARDAGLRLLTSLGFHGSPADLTGELSGGSRQKLNLTLALLGDPEILLLDEPYQGFDRNSYVDFWDLVDRWRDAGKATLVVTHVLTELHRADRVIDLPATPSADTRVSRR